MKEIRNERKNKQHMLYTRICFHILVYTNCNLPYFLLYDHICSIQVLLCGIYGFTVRQCKVEGGVTAEADGETPLKAPSQWKPLLLLIPLRLGLSEINPVYINGLKVIYKDSLYI